MSRAGGHHLEGTARQPERGRPTAAGPSPIDEGLELACDEVVLDASEALIADVGELAHLRQFPDLVPSGGWRVEIDMSVTAPFCGMGDILRQDLHDAVAALSGVDAVEVAVVFDPPWDASRLSDVARLELGVRIH